MLALAAVVSMALPFGQLKGPPADLDLINDLPPQKAKDAERPKLPPGKKLDIDVHEWGLWTFDATLEMVNAKDYFPPALPAVAPTPRTTRRNAAHALAPISVLSFHGGPGEADIDVRMDAAKPLGSWPPGDSNNRRLRWRDVKWTATPGDLSSVAYFGPDNFGMAARGVEALHASLGGRTERFLAYDAELKLPPPVALSGGPDQWKLRNAWAEPLHDVLVLARTPQGTRVGWAAVLPGDPKAGKKPGGAAKAPAPPGAAAVATKMAVAVPQKIAAGQKAPEPIATRVSPQSAEGAGGAEVAVALGPPLAPAALKAVVAELAKKLVAAGLAADEAAANAGLAADEMVGGSELLVLCRVDSATLERLLPIDITPAPRKTVRTRLLALQRLDPGAKSGIPALVKQLGDNDWPRREDAEKKLMDLGPIAWEGLKNAIEDPATELEIVQRCERILHEQRQAVPKQGGAKK